MATTTPELKWQETDRRVRHPLQAVRVYIRAYVLLEGLVSALLFAAVAIWAGLLVDWGLFWLFSFDWMLELEYLTNGRNSGMIVRVTILLVFVGWLLYIAVRKMAMRLVGEFSDRSMALVLERRFPHELQDRLITAVELADPKLAKTFGYSYQLVAKTIRDVAERVERLPVLSVFKWGRLIWLYCLLFLLTVGLVGGVGAGVCAVGALRGGDGSPSDFLWDFRFAAETWAERNLLLMHSFWPRDAYLEIKGFHDTPAHPGEMRVGARDEKPIMNARAYQWIVADHNVLGGWRPMRYGDLRAVLDGNFQDADIPDDWAGWILDPIVDEPGDWRLWTVDQIALQIDLQNPDRRTYNALALEHPAGLKTLADALHQLDVLAERPDMKHRLRRLTIPAKAFVAIRGSTEDKPETSDLTQGNKYLVDLSRIKESVRFRVHALNFSTPYKKISLVQAPYLKTLTARKEEPAYITLRLQGSQLPLKGRKRVSAQPLALTGESNLSVAVGSSVTLTADFAELNERTFDDEVVLRAPREPKLKGAFVPKQKVEKIEGHDGVTGFKLHLDNVVKAYEFEFEFRDQDGVEGRRHVIIQPRLDNPPECDAVLEVVNTKLDVIGLKEPKNTSAVLITPDAFLPIKGTIKDDYGLTGAQWVFEYEPAEFEVVNGTVVMKQVNLQGLRGNPRERRASLVLSGFQCLPGPGVDLSTFSYWAWLAQELRLDLAMNGDRGEGEQTADVFSFAYQHSERSADEIPPDQLEARLATLKEDERCKPFREVSWKDETREQLYNTPSDFASGVRPVPGIRPDVDGFDVQLHLGRKIKPSDPQSMPQLHYILRVWLSATDNNVETGPSTSRTKVPLEFLIVSEAELLTFVGMQEAELSDKLVKLQGDLNNAKVYLHEQAGKLSAAGAADVYDSIRGRIDQVVKVVEAGESNARGVLGDFSRIHRKLVANRVNRRITDKVYQKIVQPLEELTPVEANKPGAFSQCEDLLRDLRTGLEEDTRLLADGAKGLTTGPQRIQHIARCEDKLDAVIKRLNDVLQVISESVNYAKVLEDAVLLDRLQRELKDKAERDFNDKLRELLRGVIERDLKFETTSQDVKAGAAVTFKVAADSCPITKAELAKADPKLTVTKTDTSVTITAAADAAVVEGVEVNVTGEGDKKVTLKVNVKK